jgi:hypothetical protein
VAFITSIAEFEFSAHTRVINLWQLALRIPFGATHHDWITIRIKSLQRFPGRNVPHRIDRSKNRLLSASSIEADRSSLQSYPITLPSRNDWQHDLPRESHPYQFINLNS